jgi:chromate transport protein ChrA
MDVRLSTVVREWARIGALSFGGPPAQVALLRELTVEQRRWIDAREFEDANAATQLIPGPGSTQLAIYCAHRLAGLAGAIAGGLAFILPGLLLILVISAVALSESPPQWIEGVGAGAAAAVVAVVVRVGIDFARSSLAGRLGGARVRTALYLVAGVMAAVFGGTGLVLVLLACGFAELAWRRRAGAALHAWPAGLVLLAATGSAALPALAWTAFKVGALSYGGGFVIIPLMQADAVDAYGWMTRAEFDRRNGRLGGGGTAGGPPGRGRRVRAVVPGGGADRRAVRAAEELTRRASVPGRRRARRRRRRARRRRAAVRRPRGGLAVRRARRRRGARGSPVADLGARGRRPGRAPRGPCRVAGPLTNVNGGSAHVH